MFAVGELNFLKKYVGLNSSTSLIHNCQNPENTSLLE